MVILRLIGMICLVVAAVAVGTETVEFFSTTRWTPISAGQLWLNLDTTSFFATRSFIENHIFDGLWDPILVWILRQPAWVVTLIPGAACLLFSVDWQANVPGKRERPHKRDRAHLPHTS